MAITDSQPLRFFSVGLLVSAIDVGVTWLAVMLTGTRVFSVTAGFVSGLVASYLLHATVSFSVSIAPWIQLPRFLALVAINYLETIVIVLLVTENTGLSTVAGKVASLPFVALTSYLLSKHWVYSSGASLKRFGKPLIDHPSLDKNTDQC